MLQSIMTIGFMHFIDISYIYYKNKKNFCRILGSIFIFAMRTLLYKLYTNYGLYF